MAIRRRPKTESTEKLIEEANESFYVPTNTNLVVSTGSTLLDLAISGKRRRGGGMPGGILCEISGPSGSGKTAVAVEIAASIQHHGGEADILDPEARLDKEYARLYGAELDEDKNYSRPDTVNEVFDDILDWEPENKDVINGKIIDSVAALSTEKEMSKDGDKRGQLKAKQLHLGCRKAARIIAGKHKLIVFTNHEMDGEYGKVNPGGKAVPYYSSLRIRIAQNGKIEPEKALKGGAKVKKVIGIKSEAFIKKSSVDDEYRRAPIYILFGHGIDDIRANLQWYKDMTKDTKYNAVVKEYQRMDYAIRCIEEEGLEGELRNMVIDLWEEIEDSFKVKRKKKVRF